MLNLRTLYNITTILLALVLGIYCAHSFYVDIYNYIIKTQEQSHG